MSGENASWNALLLLSKLLIVLRQISQQVIDEIDGALGDGKGAVEVILKMVFFFSFFFPWQLRRVKWYIMQSKSMNKLLCRWLLRGRAVLRKGMWAKKPKLKPNCEKLPPRKGIE